MMTNSLLRRINVALLLVCVVYSSAQGAVFSLELVEPALQIGDIGTLRVIYDGGDEDFSFAVGGLDLKLSSSSPGIVKFLDANIVNDDDRWTVHSTGGITDNGISRLFAASLFTPGLSGNGPQTFAEVRYSLTGSGFTNLLVDVGGEDPLVQGDLGDVSSHVFSRGTCLGDCLPGTPTQEINLGESWARLREQMYSHPVQQPQPPVVHDPNPNPGQHHPIPDEPILPVATQPGLFSLEVIEPALQFGDQGKIRVMYHGGSENYDFANGGIGLKLTSSNPGVIKFSDAQILNPDDRWSIATARGVSDDSVAELLAFSVLTPGLSGTGSQVFAEIDYSLLGTGFTDLVLDIQGEDPLVDGDFGDVSSNLRSLGACLGDCLPGTQTQEINLGESWARLKEQMYPAPQIPNQPPVNPVVIQPVSPDPVVDEPSWTEPVPVEPVAVDPVPADPISDENAPGNVNPGGVIEIPAFDWNDLPAWTSWPIYSIVDGQIVAAIDSVPRRLGSISLRTFINTDGLELFATPIVLDQLNTEQLINIAAASDVLLYNTVGLTNTFADGDSFMNLSSAPVGVPEPGSLALVVAAIGGFILHRRGLS